MSSTNVHLRFLGMLIIVLTSLIARAEGNADLRITPASTAQDAVSASLPTPAAQDNAGSGAPTLLPESAATADTKVELVTERYPNGNVKIERQVTRDANGNYVNQGTYKAYDLDGKVQKTGEFVDGKQQGKWTQTSPKTTDIFSRRIMTPRSPARSRPRRPSLMDNCTAPGPSRTTRGGASSPGTSTTAFATANGPGGIPTAKSGWKPPSRTAISTGTWWSIARTANRPPRTHTLMACT